MDRHFRFSHQPEDADEPSDLIAPVETPEARWEFVCRQCSHLNPPHRDECEVCALDRDDD